MAINGNFPLPHAAISQFRPTHRLNNRLWRPPGVGSSQHITLTTNMGILYYSVFRIVSTSSNPKILIKLIPCFCYSVTKLTQSRYHNTIQELQTKILPEDLLPRMPSIFQCSPWGGYSRREWNGTMCILKKFMVLPHKLTHFNVTLLI